MSHYLRCEIDEKCRAHNAWSPFLVTIESLKLAQFSKDDIELQRPLLLFCLYPDLEAYIKRFEHYKEVWFLCFVDVVPDVLEHRDRMFLFTRKDLSEFEFIVGQLIETFKNHWFLQAREKLKKDLKKINDESIKAIDSFFGDQKFNFKSPESQQDLNHYYDLLKNVYFKLRTMHQHISLKEAISCVHFEELEVTLARFDGEDWALGTFENTILLPLEGTGGFDFIRVKTQKKNDLWQSLIISLIYESISRFEYILARRTDELEDNSLWEQAIAVIEQPFALLSNGGDVLVHNQSFSKLKISPKACLNFQDGQKIEEQHKLYRIKRVDLKEHHLDQFLMVFQSEHEPLDEKHRKLTTNELGIVSGSLAHELNNPIAGILSAITVLDLEETWSEDDRKCLQDMKESAKRCQHLIEIFLGFSKVNPIDKNSHKLKNSFVQALSLLRFRMIESALRIDLEHYEEQGLFEKTINSSVMSMIFYLILSDILTHFSQLRLLEQSNPNSGNIQVYLVETEQDIQINMKYRWSLEMNYEVPKLLGHLLELEGLILEIEGYSIRLQRFSLL
jgi:signal transduction histidine kinase